MPACHEVLEGGMSTALAVIALLSKHLGVSLVAAHGVETTRRLGWRRRFSMRARPAMTETQQEHERGPTPLERPRNDRSGTTTLGNAPTATR